MIIDNFTILEGAVSGAGALTGVAVVATNQVSTNSIDTGPRAIGSNQPVDLGQGNPVQFSIVTLTAPTVATSVEFQLIQADDGALTSNVQVLESSGAIPIASLPIGATVFMSPDSNVRASKRYVGLRYVVTGTATSAGTYFASVVAGKQDKATFYKSGFTLS